LAKKHANPLLPGLVIGAHGRHYVVELEDGSLLHCHPRGKKSALACGDRVQVQATGREHGAIDSPMPRSSLLYRSDEHREKIIAANVTQVVVVVAARPSFYEELLIRCLAAAENQRLRALIVLNKADLVEETAKVARELEPYAALGYVLIELSAKRDISPLQRWLAGQTSVLVGQSGMGKSTIIKALKPDAAVKIGEISQRLDSGRHTTTSAAFYRLSPDASLIDSPGMQTFGLHHLTQDELVDAFPEFRGVSGSCRFADCRHTVEPGCKIAAAVRKGAIRTRRWEVYRSLSAEIAAKRPQWD
jgi:ribosome biogenesis GTPase / thiamine phosphate phosphatase